MATILRPYHGGGRREILHQPKAYGFDTGFVGWVRGWESLHEQEYGLLWEHVVQGCAAGEVGVLVPSIHGSPPPAFRHSPAARSNPTPPAPESS